MSAYTLLLVEDDANLGFLVSELLTEEGYHCLLCTDLLKGMEAFESHTVHLCLLDVMLPGNDGFSLAKMIREKNDQIPIVFLTAKQLDDDKLVGFEIGADDYITKPFNSEELLYRLKAVLRRIYRYDLLSKQGLHLVGKYTLDVKNQILSLPNGEKRKLTIRESDVLEMLCENKNILLKKEDILVKLWGQNDYFHGRSLDVFIERLHKYLKDDPNIEIANVHRRGFVLKTLI